MTSSETPRAWRGFGRYLELVRFSHTLFALPWAMAGLLLGSRGWPHLQTLLFVTLCMVAARTAAMAFNRLIDRDFDAKNPRTQGRPSVTGAVSVPAMAVMIVVASAGFVASSYALNPLCGHLSWPTLLLLLGYSLAKRVTSFAHTILGVSLGLSPVGAALAASGEFGGPVLASAWLGVAVVLWTTGFDILYACQDVDHDRALGLKSVPARFGVENALHLARLCHFLVPVPLALAATVMPLGGIYFVGVTLVAILLVIEHRLVKASDLRRVNTAFFNVNVCISLVVLVAVTCDLCVRDVSWR